MIDVGRDGHSHLQCLHLQQIYGRGRPGNFGHVW